MDSSLRQALDGQSLRQFLAIRVVLSTGYTIRLIDGSGYVSFAVDGVTETFDGSDATYGRLATSSSLTEAVATESPTFSFSLMPSAPNAIGSLSDPKHQGSSVRVWWGAVDELSGNVIGTPELHWAGRLDTVKTQVSDGGLVAEVLTVSALDRMFVAEEGARLTPVFHKSIWPNETGLDFNVAATAQPYWGVDGGKTAVVSSSGGGGGNYGSEYRADY